MTLCAPKRSALRLGALLLPFSVLAFSACSDRAPLSPELPSPELPGGATASRMFDCVGDVRAGSVSCAEAGPGASGASRAIVGGQNVFVRLTSSDVAYNSGTGAFSFNVTLTNLLGVTAGTYPQAMGTADGVNADADGMRVFFNTGPTATSGSGTITVQTADSAALTSSEKQPLYRYAGILEPGTTTPAQGWLLNVPNTVNTFAFTLYVATQLEPAVVITEVMANPAGVTDENGEYVEIRNMGIAPVSLAGWIVQDGTSNQTSGTCTPTTTPACFGTALPGAADTIDAPLVIAAGATALLARSSNTAVNGGITPDFVYTTSVGGGLQLGNTQCNGGTGCVTDFFRIRTPNAVTIDSAAYRLTSTSAAAGTARELLDPFVDNSNVDGTNWKSATNVYDAANNNKGTPSASGGTPPTGGGNGSVQLSTSDPSTAPVGYDKPTFATVRDASGNDVTSTTKLTWESLNTAVLTVDTLGYVTGVAPGTAQIRATAPSGATGTFTYTIVEATAAHTALYRNHEEFGTPVDATPDDEYRIARPQYVSSYNPARGGPNWVAWNLNGSQFEQGSNNVQRCNCFTDEPTLPMGAVRTWDFDYRGSGYDRGHMVQSESRTNTFQENATTFLMANILPQAGENNQGPWLTFENYLNNQVRTGGKEVYVIAGGEFAATPPTLKGQGRVAIPSYTWKVAVIVDAGEGLSSVGSTADLTVIAIRIPNLTTGTAGSPGSAVGIRNTSWEAYRTTVDNIEALTGYDLLAALNDAIEAAVEAQ